MKIVLIGGNGFLGKNIYLKLKYLKKEVIVVDRMLQKETENFICSSLDDIDKLSNIIEKGDCVIHLASSIVPITSGKNLAKELEENVMATIRLFEICIQKQVKKIIFSSSGGGIYGMPEYLPIDEKHRTDPISTYGIHKLVIEKYLCYISRTYNIQTIILRIANPYGYGQVPFTGQGVIATYIASAMLNREIEIWGKGENRRDYIFIDDVSHAFLKAIEYSSTSEIFNIGTGRASSLNDIIQIISHTIRRELKLVYKDEMKAEVHDNFLDCQKAKKILGWNFEISLEEGIKKMISLWSPEQQLFVNKSGSGGA